MTTDEYLQKLPKAQATELERVRSIAKKLVPEAEETFSYGMPALKYKGKPLLYFAAFKNHMSVFPTAGPAEELKELLTDFKVSKGTIQFTNEHPLPEKIIVAIIISRLRQIEG